MNLNLSSGIPVATFDQNSTAFLANPNNYYLDMIQPNMNRASADLVAWKADAKFRFDDDVLRDFRFGARLTTRRAMHQNPAGSGWYGVGQDWAVQPTSVPGQLPVLADFQNPDGSRNYGILWKNINYPYMNDPRFVLPAAGGGVTVASFSGKNAGMPNIVVPSMALLKNYPGVQASPGVAATGYYAMANLKQTLCSDARNVQYTASNGLAGQLYGNTAAAPSSTNQYGTPYNPGGCVTQGLDFTPQSYSNVIQNPNNGTQAATDKHSEDTQAIYGSLRFGFEDWKFPVDGFAGLRVIRTRAVVHGWTTMNLLKPDGNPSIPKFDTTLSANTPIDYVGTSVDAIPSLNLKAAFSPTLQGRLALSQGMYRPGFNQLQEYINFNQQVITLPGSSAISQVIYNGGNSGNAKLKPVKSNNADLSLEWYPANGQSVTAALFAKQVKDIIMSDTYIRTLTDLQNNTQDFIITGPANAAKLWQAGFEISGMTYLDKVPVLDKALPVQTDLLPCQWR
jgi:outer membrane receptor protein involved in Fe transport